MGIIYVDPKVTPELGAITLHVGPGGGTGEGLELTTWDSYSFNSHFLTPTDGWSFTLGDETVTDQIRTAIAPRQQVTLSVDGIVLATGIVDKVRPHSTRNGGLKLTIEGRDRLGQAISSCIDPRQEFKPGMSLRDLLGKVFQPFGWGPDHILATDEALDLLDQNVALSTAAPPPPTPAASQAPVYTTGQAIQSALQALAAQNSKTTKQAAPPNPVFSKGAPVPTRWRGHGLTPTSSIRTTSKKGKPLKDFQLHLLKPHAGEGAFQFAARVAQRFGLWIWPSSDGSLLIVGKPDFTVTPELRAIKHKDGSANNVLDSELVLDMTDQPSIIFAKGFGGGGASPRDQFTLAVVNPLISGIAHDDIFAAYPNTKPIDLNYLGPGYGGNGKDIPTIVPANMTTTLSILNGTGYAKPLFLEDQESKNIEELTAFLKRELALRMHKAYVYHFEVEGHSYKTPDGRRIPWEVDAMVAVDDEVCNVKGNLWILSRTFMKSRNGGTKTKIEAILPNTLVF